MKGLLKDAVLIGVTAVAVTAYQGYAQDDGPELRYDLKCPSGQIVAKSYQEGPAGDMLFTLGFTGYYAQIGQVTMLTNCEIVAYEFDPTK